MSQNFMLTWLSQLELSQRKHITPTANMAFQRNLNEVLRKESFFFFS